MAVPLLTKKIVKKRVKQFKRPHLDRYKCLKVGKASPVALNLVARSPCSACLLFVDPLVDCYITFTLGSPEECHMCTKLNALARF